MDCIGVDAQTDTITIMHGHTPVGHCHTSGSVYAQLLCATHYRARGMAHVVSL